MPKKQENSNFPLPRRSSTYSSNNSPKILLQENKPEQLALPNPDSREDAVLLDRWLSRKIAEWVKTVDFGKVSLRVVLLGVEPLLSVAMNEVVRSVGHACSERGDLLGRVWAAYVQVFSGIAAGMATGAALRDELSGKVENQLLALHTELEQARQRQPASVDRAIRAIEHEFERLDAAIGAKISEASAEGNSLKREYRRLKALYTRWFPELARMRTKMKTALVKRAEDLGGLVVVGPSSSSSSREGRSSAVASSRPPRENAGEGPDDDEEEEDSLGIAEASEAEHNPEMVALAKDLRRLLVLCPDRAACRDLLWTSMVGHYTKGKSESTSSSKGSSSRVEEGSSPSSAHPHRRDEDAAASYAQVASFFRAVAPKDAAWKKRFASSGRSTTAGEVSPEKKDSRSTTVAYDDDDDLEEGGQDAIVGSLRVEVAEQEARIRELEATLDELKTLVRHGDG